MGPRFPPSNIRSWRGSGQNCNFAFTPHRAGRNGPHWAVQRWIVRHQDSGVEVSKGLTAGPCGLCHMVTTCTKNMCMLYIYIYICVYTYIHICLHMYSLDYENHNHRRPWPLAAAGWPTKDSKFSLSESGALGCHQPPESSNVQIKASSTQGKESFPREEFGRSVLAEKYRQIRKHPQSIRLQAHPMLIASVLDALLHLPAQLLQAFLDLSDF